MIGYFKKGLRDNNFAELTFEELAQEKLMYTKTALFFLALTILSYIFFEASFSNWTGKNPWVVLFRIFVVIGAFEATFKWVKISKEIKKRPRN